MKKGDVKEDFCPSCLVVPIAFAGAGATAVGGTMPDDRKRTKKALLISGVVTIGFSLLVGAYYLLNKKNCTQCKA